jgi:hypothetical protein
MRLGMAIPGHLLLVWPRASSLTLSNGRGNDIFVGSWLAIADLREFESSNTKLGLPFVFTIAKRPL